MTKNVKDRIRIWLTPIVALGQNPVTLLGAALTTSSAITMIGFWGYALISAKPVTAYAGIIGFLILPAFFVAGLVIMPLGALWQRKRLRRSGQSIPLIPRLKMSDPVFRRAVGIVSLATVLNVVLISMATILGVEHMDSVQFCGQACHSVMAPEYTTYKNSPHARVACVACHIGPGAPWFVRSKLSGTRQIFAVAFKTYSRPIPTPVKHLRPARETCEQCHWPAKFHGDKFLVRTHYSKDEQNTPMTTVLLMKIGGRSARGRVGIHGRHIDDKARITYVAVDEKREVIPKVTYIDDDGKRVEFVSKAVDATPEQLASGERREMDCMDCHNRPSHIFTLPERALDQAMEEGRIATDLPYAKKTSVELLRADYRDRAKALERIPEDFVAFYRSNYPELLKKRRAEIDAAAATLCGIYAENVFPSMKVGWGTYANHIGHEDDPGCFRCHDDEHNAEGGQSISQDCESCHIIFDDPKILAELGLQ